MNASIQLLSQAFVYLRSGSNLNAVFQNSLRQNNMTLNTKYVRTTVLIVLLGSVINSCEKNQPDCGRNCVNISISGNIYIKTSGVPLANVPVEVKWFRKAYCIGCTSYKVVSGKSGDDGTFNFNTTIDSTFFEKYSLSVRIPRDTNYITTPYKGSDNFNEERFDDFNLTAMQNLKFEFYPKTFLTIKLHRSGSDNFNYFSVDHKFTNDFSYADYLITNPQFTKDSVLRVPTSANIYTKIIWKKMVIGGQSNQQTDSLICTNNGNNIFSINY